MSEYEMFALAGYNTEELISFLRMKKNLKLDEDDLKIIHKEKIIGSDIFNLTQEELTGWGMAGGPTRRLLEFFRETKEKTSRPFSSSNVSSETLVSNNEYVFSDTLVSEHLQKFLSEKSVSINQYED